MSDTDDDQPQALIKPRWWHEPFLEALRRNPVVSTACRDVGISRGTPDEAKQKCPVFAARMAEAIETGIDRAEAEAYRRAVEGYEDPVYQGGEMVGTRRVYSDRLLELILKSRRRDMYGDKSEVTGKVATEVVIVTGVPQARIEADVGGPIIDADRE